MSGLPESWEASIVGDVATVQLGRQRSPKNHSGPHMRPYLRSANVTWHGIDVFDVKEMNFEPDEATTFELKEGDILLNEASGSPGEVGKPAIWRNEIPGACFQNTLLRVRSAEMDEGYLYWYFYSAAFSGRFGEAGRGVNIRHLGKQGLASFPIPVPPLPEQRRIVAAIEEHFSRLEAAEASIHSAKVRSAVLKRSLLTAMFDGLDHGCALDEVCEVVSGQTPKKLAQAEPGDIPFVKVGDMNDTEDGLVRTARQRISRSSADELGLHVRPPGTVIFPKRGGAIATNKKRTLAVNACFDLNTMGVIPGPDVLSPFLRHWFETVDLGSLSDGSNVPQINHGDIKPLRIPVPAIADQERLVAEIDEALEFVSAGERSAAAAARRVAPARSAVLAAAFFGRLVPQDSSDEPASALLERIAAERAASKPSRMKKAAS